MLYVFEMANNHQGKVSHAKRIIEEFSKIAKEKEIIAAIKLQFRQLDTFIHNDYKNSDLKFVKRFNSTRLSKEEFSEIVDHIRHHELIPMATPFDNESIPWFEDMSIPIIKIASCSIDDWPLLEEVSNINKKIIISTAGANMETLKKVYNLFKQKQRDFSFMHCVGEYPTPIKSSNLDRISKFMKEFPDIEIGFSTHESPKQKSLSPYAIALGCTILEKHVGIETKKIKLNAYSNTPEQIREVIEEIQLITESMTGKSDTQNETLVKLKRGVYLKRDIEKGQVITKEDVYYAMPVQDGQLNASNVNAFINRQCSEDLTKDSPLRFEQISAEPYINFLQTELILEAVNILKAANIPLSGEEKVEISCHYGLQKAKSVGAIIIDKINREYCKKLIVLLPNQKHPSHYHIKKEEAFELLYGDCTLVLNGKEIPLKRGKPVLIPRKVMHSFFSEKGCVVEEVSTTHHRGDSIYENPDINSLKIEDRKIKIKLS